VADVPLGSLGRIKPGRHRPPAHEQEELVPDEELTSYLAALAPDTDVETTGSGRSFGNAQVYQLRLQLMANEQLKELANERQTSPQALATEWVMQRLEWEARQRGY
jgi:aryl-alcohol dehydrogenase-like predicted oxidoreductase